MIAELDRVILTEDLPEYGLKAGDIGTVVLTPSGRGKVRGGVCYAGWRNSGRHFSLCLPSASGDAERNPPRPEGGACPSRFLTRLRSAVRASMARSTHPTPFLQRLALGELYEGSIGEVHWAIMVFSHQGVQYGHICIVNGTNSDRPRTQKCPCGFNLTAILTNEMKQLSEDSRRSHERQKELSKGLYTCAMPTIIAVEKSEEPVSIKPLARIPLG